MGEKQKLKRQHDDNAIKLANEYARVFNRLCEKRGIDIPMPVIGSLIQLFRDAISTGEALEADYGLVRGDEARNLASSKA